MDIMKLLKLIFRKIRGFIHIKKLFSRLRLKYSNTEGIFTKIYKNNEWNGSESVSGVGSDWNQTRHIAKELPILFSKLKVSKILDVPCGDFNWMRKVALNDIYYIGADIVEDIVDANNEKYSHASRIFKKLNLIEDSLPQSDIVFCRDCLVHLSYKDIYLALNNICHSNSCYLITTTNPLHVKNEDIMTGEWRRLNLEIEPFNFPRPVELLNERCTEREGADSDKSLGVWYIDDIRDIVQKFKA